MFWIELIATFFGFACVVLTIRRNIWCWPTGLVQVLLFIIIFYDAKLYSDLILHVIYVGLQIYGWNCWLAQRTLSDDAADLAEETVTSLSQSALTIWFAVTVIGTIVLGLSMKTFTDAALPFADAFTTVASLVAQYLLAHKKLESWLFWIAVDVISIGIYVYKSLIPTSVLYSAFLVLAIIGYVAWRRTMTRTLATGETA